MYCRLNSIREECRASCVLSANLLFRCVLSNEDMLRLLSGCWLCFSCDRTSNILAFTVRNTQGTKQQRRRPPSGKMRDKEINLSGQKCCCWQRKQKAMQVCDYSWICFLCDILHYSDFTVTTCVCWWGGLSCGLIHEAPDTPWPYCTAPIAQTIILS